MNKNRRTRILPPVGKFGNWLRYKMNEHDITYLDLCKQMKISRQTISNHEHHAFKPLYPFVIAYCNILGGDPEEVWKLVEEDWGD